MAKVFGFSTYGGSEVQEFRDDPLPESGPAELLVAVRAAGVNPVDWKIRQGLLSGGAHLTSPAVLGSELAGVVEKVGGDVAGFAVGDEILGTPAPGSGAFAEYAAVPAVAAAKKPTGVSWTDAAALPVAAATAYDAVHQLALSAGATLLIVGVGGGVGVVAAQIARDLGLNVVGVASVAKRALTESLGATLVTSGPGVADRVRAILPDGVDAILDLVGGGAAHEVAELLEDRTKLLSSADPSVAELGGQLVARDGTGVVLAAVAALVAAGKLDPHVSDVVPFDDAAQAMASVEAGHTPGKIVLHVR